MTCFTRLNKNVYRQKLKNIKNCTYFILKLSLLLIFLSDAKTKLTFVISEYSCSENIQILGCYQCQTNGHDLSSYFSKRTIYQCQQGHKLLIYQCQTNRNDLVSYQYQSEACNYQLPMGMISARIFQKGPSINVNRNTSS